MATIPVIRQDDILEFKKPHPCGGKRFRVMRVGSDVRVVCCVCGRDMVLDRLRLEHAIRKNITFSEENTHD